MYFHLPRAILPIAHSFFSIAFAIFSTISNHIIFKEAAFLKSIFPNCKNNDQA